MIQTTEKLGTSAAAIEHIYDVGNEFFELFLGSSMTMSSALWHPFDSLESAQIRQMDYHIAQSRAKGAKRVLDIGCGWGTLLKRLVNEYEVEQAIGITLSPSQVDWIRQFNHAQIEVRHEDWLDHVPDAPYDAIVAVEMVDHCAKTGLSSSEKITAYRTFFERCHEWLNPGGCLSIQLSTYGSMLPDEASQIDSSILAQIEDCFPESELPFLSEIVKSVESTFEIVTMRSDREHYAQTLKAWLKLIDRNREAAIAAVGEAAVDRYEKFFQYSLFGYLSGATTLVRLGLRRIDHPWQWYLNQ